MGWPPTPQVYFGPWEGLRVVFPRGLPKLRILTFPPVGAPQAREFSLFPPVGAPQAREFSLFPPVGAPQAREFSLFPPVGAPQAREFSLFPPWGLPKLGIFTFPRRDSFPSYGIFTFPSLEALQAAEFQIAGQRRLDSPPNPVFFECVSMFLQWFPSKHGTLHFCRHKTGRKHHVRQCFQFPYLPNRWTYRYLQCFLQFFHVPMPVANSNIYIYKKSFQNIVFDSVFPMFPVKQTVIYTFFAIKTSKSFQNIAFDSVFVMVSSQAYGNLHVFCYNVSPKHLFLQCFQCSGIQKPCKILLCTMFFFIFGRFSIAGKLPKWPKIPFQYPLALRHPKILEKCRKHHHILVSVRNRFWAPPS